MIRGDTIGWHIESWKKHAITILRIGLADGGVANAARALIQDLGRRGFQDYRSLLSGDEIS